MNASGQPTVPAPRARWEIPFAAALLAATVWIACFWWTPVWRLTGIGQGDKPFLDLRNLISAGQSAQLGFDPHVKNPLDPFNRPHGYSDWWLVTGDLGLDGDDVAWLGMTLLVLTLVSAAWAARPATARQGLALLLVLASPPLLMAVHRANHDLVVFALMCASLAGLRSERGWVRAAGVALLAVSAVLKYFPLAAIILLLEARDRRELLRWAGLYGLVLLLALPSLTRGFEIAVTHMPAPSWLYAFGAPVMFRDFELPAAALLGWLLAGGLLVAGTVMGRPRATGPTAWTTPTRDFACGAVMIVGCFLHGSSYVYKLVFALWLLPGLWQPAHNAAEDRWRRLTWALLIGVLWFEGLVAVLLNVGAFSAVFSPTMDLPFLKAGLAIEQLLTWALMAFLWRYLVAYLDHQRRRWLGAAG